MVYCFSISYSTSPAVCIRFISILASIWRKAQKSFQIQSIYKETSFKNSLSLWVMVAIQSLEIVFFALRNNVFLHENESIFKSYVQFFLCSQWNTACTCFLFFFRFIPKFHLFLVFRSISFILNLSFHNFSFLVSFEPWKIDFAQVFLTEFDWIFRKLRFKRKLIRRVGI